jgi:hypothetical protein
MNANRSFQLQFHLTLRMVVKAISQINPYEIGKIYI